MIYTTNALSHGRIIEVYAGFVNLRRNYGTYDWYILVDTLRKIRNDRIAAELDEHATDLDQALQGATWRTKEPTVHAYDGGYSHERRQ